MRRLSLKTELSWLIGLVMLMNLVVNLSILIAHAGPRIRAEDETSLHLTRELVVTAIGSLQETDDPLPALSRFYQSLGNLRHVDVKVLSADNMAQAFPATSTSKIQNDVPGWFVELVHAPPRTLIIPVTIKGVNYGRIAITSNPVDELAEIWSDVSRLTGVGLLVASVILGLVLLLVRASLKPFEGLRRALADLEAGKSNVRAELRGAMEFRVISAALNSLAATLERVKTENRGLLDRLIRVQDDERKEIARDLHDEAGPCLFSIRAGVVTLAELTADATADVSQIQQACMNVNRASEILQSVFRALLGRLAPRGLSELGLREVLKGLINSWRLSRSDVTLELVCPHDLSTLNESIALTAFRVVQESITNVFRHAHANWALVRVELGSTTSSSSPEHGFESAPALLITIEDNGVGIPDRPHLGLGLLGMRERVQALGGMISIERRAGGGTCVAASLPLPKDDEDDP